MLLPQRLPISEQGNGSSNPTPQLICHVVNDHNFIGPRSRWVEVFISDWISPSNDMPICDKKRSCAFLHDESGGGSKIFAIGALDEKQRGDRRTGYLDVGH